MKKKLGLLAGLSLLAPVAVFAQVGNISARCTSHPGIFNLNDVLCKIGDLLNAIVPILIALGVVYFVWGVITYVVSADEEVKTKGRDKMIYGIIGLAVIIGLWGLVKILTNTFGVDNAGQNITYPTTPY